MRWNDRGRGSLKGKLLHKILDANTKNGFRLKFVIKDLLTQSDQFIANLSNTQTLQLFINNLKRGGVYHIYKVIKNSKIKSLGRETY